MIPRTRRGRLLAAATAATAAAAALLALGQSSAEARGDLRISGVPAADPKAPGIVAPNVLTSEWLESPVAQGAVPVENPTDWATHYG